MSVRAGERNQGKLQVLNKCKDMVSYSMHLMKNDKVFPKSYRWLITQHIADECLCAFTCIRHANSIYPQNANEQQLQYREMEQRKAYAHLEGLLTLVDVAYNTINIEERRIEYWTKLIVETETMLRAWIESDKEYKNKG